MILMVTVAVAYTTSVDSVTLPLGIVLMGLLLLYIAICMFTLPDVHLSFAKAGCYVLAVVIFILALASLSFMFADHDDTQSFDDFPYPFEKRKEISVSIMYLIIYTGVFVGTALIYPKEFLCNLQSLWYLLCLPGLYIFLPTYAVVNMARTTEGRHFLIQSVSQIRNMDIRALGYSLRSFYI